MKKKIKALDVDISFENLKLTLTEDLAYERILSDPENNPKDGMFIIMGDDFFYNSDENWLDV